MHPGDLEMRFNLFQTYFSAWKSRTKSFGVFVRVCEKTQNDLYFGVSKEKGSQGSDGSGAAGSGG